VQGRVACEARARAHRNFKDKDEFIQGMRGVVTRVSCRLTRATHLPLPQDSMFLERVHVSV
jgi:hypothetical protein